MDEIDPIFLEIDRLIRHARLKEIEFIMSLDVSERVCEMRAALERLSPGQYLLGTGPSTVGIVPLNTRDVVLGRPPTVVETPTRAEADYCAIDTLYFVPREISRTHAKVVRQTGSFGIRHVLLDLHSTCGTFVNEMLVDPEGEGAVLDHGDVISLGPSRTNTYVYYRVRQLGLNRAPVQERRVLQDRPQWSGQME
jgi:pSer/pThr/pTyr-binding forkhead associated (FHA) protein